MSDNKTETNPFKKLALLVLGLFGKEEDDNKEPWPDQSSQPATEAAEQQPNEASCSPA